ncbi:microfibrillar-associated protein 2 [Clupea harengus]|uniref:Microfibrillar-associated protein 2 n=1 Tax=Clupea harengus TaxID=7950 RepID=A0A6P3W2X3_CLUHA|nr:microfibrillar-associated protein 2 [Clupea harengus]
MKVNCLLLLAIPVLVVAQFAQAQDYFPLEDYNYGDNPDLDASPQQQILLEPAVVPGQSGADFTTEPTEPGPLDCREEQYPCTRLYSVHQPCKQCLNSLCFYSLRRVYVINKEICVRTVCAHEELLKADLCRDQFSRCGVAALGGHCGSMGGSCGKSCGGC